MQSYTLLVPMTGISEEFCFCFLLVAGLLSPCNGRCSEIMRAAAMNAGGGSLLLPGAMASEPPQPLRACQVLDA